MSRQKRQLKKLPHLNSSNSFVLNMSELHVLAGKSGNTYSIIKSLFKNSKTIIYQAICHETKLPVAIKFLSEEKCRSELKILEIISDIKCPYLLKLLDTIFPVKPITNISSNSHDEESNSIGFVFPIYDMTLLDYLVTRKRIPIKRIKKIIYQIANGIKVLHENKIVHLDIKLENIMINENHDIVIIDYGYSEFLGNRTMINRFCGSYAYVSPEQIKLNAYNPYKSDVWSFGVLIYAILYNQLPFISPKNTIEELFDSISDSEIDIPETIPPAARDLIFSMLDRNPHTRIMIHDVINHLWIQSAAIEIDNEAETDNSSYEILINIKDRETQSVN